MALTCAVVGEPLPKRMMGVAPDMLSIHGCESGGRGVSDLIGYVVEED